jgi:CheY-like chemotaxis protein
LTFYAIPADNPHVTNSAPKVLVVEDDALLADLLATIIESADYQPIVAADAFDGVRLARTISPALVFCDMSMPGLTGEEVLQTLRADPSTADLPVVLMSGHDRPNLRSIGADAFLAKPFLADTVLNLLRTLSSSATNTVSEPLAAA